MKFALSVSVIALGIGLACAGQFAAAAPTVTISQSGTGNTVAAEQRDLAPDAEVSATITQNGTNNHVGGPGGTTGGILQYGPSSRAVAKVTQTGTGNTVPVSHVSATARTPMLAVYACSFFIYPLLCREWLSTLRVGG